MQSIEDKNVSLPKDKFDSQTALLKDITDNQLLLKNDQIAKLLNMSESNAKKVLMRYGIQPIDLGRCRGNGLRRLTSAIIEVADILHTEAQTKSSSKRKKYPHIQ